MFVNCLENENVEYIFGLAGEENLHLLEAIRKSKIKFIPVRHEQSAGFMAATYGRLTGKPGVCLATLGPGATNLITAVAYAKLGAMPMVVITGQKPVMAAPQGAFQIIDVVGTMKPITKYSTSISYGNTIPARLRQAFRIAAEERPGPVHVELPKDIALIENDTEPLPIAFTRRPVPEVKAIKKAVEVIEQAKHPLILIGASADRHLVAESLLKFVEKTGIPFFSTQMGKGVIDEHHQLCLGTAAVSANDYVHSAIAKADLIINVGHDVIEKPPFLMNKNNAEVIHINYYPADVDQVYYPQYEVVGDIAAAVRMIAGYLNNSPNWDFSYFHKVKQIIDQKLEEQTDSKSYPFKPQRIVKAVRDSLPEDGIAALDNGMYKLWFARYFKSYRFGTLLLDNALATMGAGLPSAIATKLIYPDKKVIAVCGDGGFMMNSQEISTAVALGLDLVILIINDNGLGMIKWEQDEKQYPSFGLDLKNPDFVQYANSYGANGILVENEQELDKILQEAFAAKGVTVIDCPVDYSENIKVFSEELHEPKNI